MGQLVLGRLAGGGKRADLVADLVELGPDLLVGQAFELGLEGIRLVDHRLECVSTRGRSSRRIWRRSAWERKYRPRLPRVPVTGRRRSARERSPAMPTPSNAAGCRTGRLRPPGSPDARSRPSSAPWRPWIVLACQAAGSNELRGGPPRGRTPPPASADPAGWVDLFDGGATHGLRAYGGGAFPSDRWEIVDGVLRTISGTGVDLVTDALFEDFELEFSWAVSPGGNSGVMIGVQEDDEPPGRSGPVVRLLDDAGHPDGQDPADVGRGAVCPHGGGVRQAPGPGRRAEPVPDRGPARVTSSTGSTTSSCSPMTGTIRPCATRSRRASSRHSPAFMARPIRTDRPPAPRRGGLVRARAHPGAAGGWVTVAELLPGARDVSMARRSRGCERACPSARERLRNTRRRQRRQRGRASRPGWGLQEAGAVPRRPR